MPTKLIYKVTILRGKAEGTRYYPTAAAAKLDISEWTAKVREAGYMLRGTALTGYHFRRRGGTWQPAMTVETLPWAEASHAERRAASGLGPNTIATTPPDPAPAPAESAQEEAPHVRTAERHVMMTAAADAERTASAAGISLEIRRLISAPAPAPDGTGFDPLAELAGLDKALHSKQWEVAYKLLPWTRTALIWGIPGNGKTYFGGSLARANGWNHFPVTLTRDMSSAEQKGHWIPLPEGGFGWLDGSAVLAFLHGGLLQLDEIGHASEETLNLFNVILDSEESASLTLPTAERITVHPDFRCFATSNYPPSEIYESLRSRFDIVLEVNDPSPFALAALPPSLRMAAKGSIQKEADPRYTLRHWFSYAKLSKHVDPLIAAVGIFGADRAQAIVDSIGIAKVER